MLLDPAITFLCFLVFSGKVDFQTYVCLCGCSDGWLGEIIWISEELLTICHSVTKVPQLSFHSSKEWLVLACFTISSISSDDEKWILCK